MSVPSEIITAASVITPLCGIAWFFFRKWAERMESMESKIDRLMEYRLACRTTMITREEYSSGMARVHERIDEHLATEQDLASRVARLEGGQ